MTDYVKREDVLLLIREESSAWEGEGDDVAGARNALACVADSVRSIPEAPVSEEREYPRAEEVAKQIEAHLATHDLEKHALFREAVALLRALPRLGISHRHQRLREALKGTLYLFEAHAVSKTDLEQIRFARAALAGDKP